MLLSTKNNRHNVQCIGGINHYNFKQKQIVGRGGGGGGRVSVGDKFASNRSVPSCWITGTTSSKLIFNWIFNFSAHLVMNIALRQFLLFLLLLFFLLFSSLYILKLMDVRPSPVAHPPIFIINTTGQPYIRALHFHHLDQIRRACESVTACCAPSVRQASFGGFL